MSGIFPVSIDLWKISCGMGAKTLCNVCRIMGFNLVGPADSIQAACQCLQQLCLCQAFLGGDLAGMVGWF